MFLRKHMDSQGYVFLSVIANFNRIRQLTQDVELIRFAVMQTGELEFRPGADGVDRLRRRAGWEQFVLDMADRDESVRNEGPSQSTPPPMNYTGPEAAYLYPNRQVASPSEFAALEAGYAPYGIMPGYGNPELAMNGMANGNSHHVETPLSAAVPDFSPAIPPINGTGFASVDAKKSENDKFTDEQIDSLRIVVRNANSTKSPQAAPFHYAASRTFSNGSIDSRSIAAELGKPNSHSPRPLANGHGQTEP
jgi:la-related protein 1